MSAAVIIGIYGAALIAAKSSQVRRAEFSCWIILESESAGIWSSLKDF